MLDDLRNRFPELGFSVFAMEPRGVVTLEIYTPDGEVYSFVANTMSEAISKAFPKQEVEEDNKPEQPASNVFD